MIFIGHYARTIDKKGRLQIPSQLRNAIEESHEGKGLYVMLGERPNTLSLVTEQQFSAMGKRIRTECIPGKESLDFEQQFYSTTAHTGIDKQGRIVLPDYLTNMAGLKGDVMLAGADYRIDIWRKAAFEEFLKIDSDGGWHNFHKFLRASSTVEQDRRDEATR